MRKLKITIQYDGSSYHGWQVQKNAVTVQEVFQDAVEKVFLKRLDVTGCSRTDSFVHANMYVLTLETDMNISNEGVIMALNSKLPSDIAVIDCEECESDFHPRYSCKSKEYIYKLIMAKGLMLFCQNMLIITGVLLMPIILIFRRRLMSARSIIRDFARLKATLRIR